MNVTLAGVLLVLLFVLPGFVCITTRHEWQPNRRLDASELYVTCIAYSLFANLPLLVAVLLLSSYSPTVLEIWTAIAAPLVDKNWTPTSIDALGIVVFVSLYALVASFLGYLMGLLQVACRTGAGADRIRPVWLRFFTTRRLVKQVRVRMKNGLLYVGAVKYTPFDWESTAAQQREFVIVCEQVQRLSDEGNIEAPAALQLPTGTLVLLSTRDIDAIELMQAETEQPPKSVWSET